MSTRDPLVFEEPLQEALHAYLTPHPELGTETDERGCVACFLIARAIAPAAASVDARALVGDDTTRSEATR